MVIFTCSIFPHLTRVWYDYTRIILGKDIDIYIYDCGGKLDKNDFPGAFISKHANDEHGIKIDHFLRTTEEDLVFIMDDDTFIARKELFDEVHLAFKEDKKLGIYAMHERDHWQYEVAGKTIKPIGTYAFAVNGNILLEEKLSLKSFRSNESWVNNGKGYWDTANFAQYQLLKRSYNIKSRNGSKENSFPTLFGTSSGFISIFKKRLFSKGYKLKLGSQQLSTLLNTDEYFLARAIAVRHILDIYEILYGRTGILFPFSLKELEGKAVQFFPTSTYMLETPNQISKLILSHLNS